MGDCRLNPGIGQLSATVRPTSPVGDRPAGIPPKDHTADPADGVTSDRWGAKEITCPLREEFGTDKMGLYDNRQSRDERTTPRNH
jgi:hypothetical protein